jgi:hypothetical protein
MRAPTSYLKVFMRWRSRLAGQARDDCAPRPESGASALRRKSHAARGPDSVALAGLIGTLSRYVEAMLSSPRQRVVMS